MPPKTDSTQTGERTHGPGPRVLGAPQRRARAIAEIATATGTDAAETGTDSSVSGTDSAPTADTAAARADGRTGSGARSAEASRAEAMPAEALSGETRPVVPALSDDVPVLGLIDLDEVDEMLAQLRRAFASETAVLHAVACKAVPLRSVLRRCAEAGAGCEVASPGELELALLAGFAPEAIVFDSPAKTMSELRRGLDLGVSVNVDSWEELDRLDVLIAGGPGRAGSERSESSPPAPASVIGVRINTQSGSGEIGALSTATETSKFGIGLSDPGAREALVEAFLARPWLTQIHVHSGSQGIGLEQIADGAAAAVDLACEINRRAAVRDAVAGSQTDAADGGEARQVTRIDIGGGLPVNFSGDEVTPTFADYRAVLDARAPGLFDFDVVTEFGRALLAKAGTILTRVEYAKTTGGRRIAMTHAGVQVATRTAYAPEDWPLRILPFTPDGGPKFAEAVPTDVAGPACFAGDLLAEDRMLPRLDAGDLVAVPDTGAYYFSNPFSYNLLPRIPVWGYREVDGLSGDLEFSHIRRGQSTAEVLAETGEAEISPWRPTTEQTDGGNRARLPETAERRN